MRYYGGKGRIGKELAEFLKKLMLKKGVKNYMDAFCGALGVSKHMEICDEENKPIKGYKYICNDICKDIILLWKAVKNKTFKNPHMTKVKWDTLKKSTTPSAERAFAGYGCSFGGIYFSSYVNVSHNLPDRVFENLYKDNIKHITFTNMDYKKLTKYVKNGGYLIYCDPPYKGTICEPYEGSKKTNFSSEEFWEIARLWKKMGNLVVISEFNAPKDFKCIWKKVRKNTVNPKGFDNGFFVERLYIYTPKTLLKDFN